MYIFKILFSTFSSIHTYMTYILSEHILVTCPSTKTWSFTCTSSVSILFSSLPSFASSKLFARKFHRTYKCLIPTVLPTHFYRISAESSKNFVFFGQFFAKFRPISATFSIKMFKFWPSLPFLLHFYVIIFLKVQKN